MNLGTRRGVSYAFLALMAGEMMNPRTPSGSEPNDREIQCTKNFHKQTGKRAKRREKGKNK